MRSTPTSPDPVQDATGTSYAEVAQFTRRLDGWASLLTGLGTRRDKRTSVLPQTAEKLPYEVCYDLYRSDPFAARIVDRPVQEMVRKWIETKIADEKDAGEDVDHWLESLGAREVFAQAEKWKRAFGGAGILLGIDDEHDPDILAQPLDEGGIKTVSHLTVFSARELQTTAYYADPQLPNFGLPAIYRIVPLVPFGISGQPIQNFGSTYTPSPTQYAQLGTVPTHPWSILPEVHESRLLKFDGRVADRRQRLQNWGWGDSIYQTIWEILRDFAAATGGVSQLLSDFSQAIFSTPGLSEALASDQENKIVKRAELLDMTRSIARMVLLDGGEPGTGAGAEKFERVTTPLTGVPELLDRLAMLVSAASDMPVTLLFGQSPKGLGNEGMSDVANWFDHIDFLRKADLGPPLRRLVSLGMIAKKGPTKGRIFERWTCEWEPLAQMTEEQLATVRKTVSDADSAMIDRGVVTPSEVRSSRYGGDGYSLETQLDVGEEEDREAFGKEPAIDPTIRDPGAGELSSPGAGSADLQALALNGTQITGLLAILAAVRDGSLPAESAIVALTIAFPAQLTAERAKELVTPIEVKEPPKIQEIQKPGIPPQMKEPQIPGKP